MNLNLIYARAKNGVIGKNNAMPWHLPEDLAHFKRLTLGCPVIMGRKTWESIPAKFRPLPGRVNLVLTRQENWHENGVLNFTSLDYSLRYCEQNHVENVWVMGGAQIYAQAVSRAHTAVVTEIDAEFEGDAYAPVLDHHWVETQREHHISANGLKFSFVTYVRPSIAKP